MALSELETLPKNLQDDEGTSISATPPSRRRPKSASGLWTKPKTRRKSPPLADNLNEDPLTWHDSEITVFDPTDPNDDGYGINGVGFKPTAAIAWDRLQKRKKQIAEWKSREAREAREKRRERRDGIVDECSKPESKTLSRKKVKFDT
jgi:nucleolar protein 56